MFHFKQPKATTIAPIAFVMILAIQIQTEIVVGQDQAAEERIVLQSQPRQPTIKRISPRGSRSIPQPTVTLKKGQEPKIVFDKLEYDFGRKRAGVIVHQDYEFTNTGTGPLELLRVKPGCGCTGIDRYIRIIQPGQRGKIPVKVNTAQLHGHVIKTVTVNTNAPGEGARIILRITGDVWHPFELTPLRASFGRIDKGSLISAPATQTLTIVNNMKNPAKLSHIRSSLSCFSGKIKTIEPGRKYELQVMIDGSADPGLNNGTIGIDTGLSEVPLLKVPVTAYVISPVDIIPAKLTLLPNRTKLVKRSLFVTNHTSQPITISDLKVSDPAIKVKLIDTGSGMNFRVTVEIPANHPLPPEGAIITMRTSHPQVPQLMARILEARAPIQNRQSKK